MPAVGFAMGDVVIKDLLDQKFLLPNYVQAPDVFAVIGSDAALPVALQSIHLLRQAGYSVDYPIRPLGFRKQFKAANDSAARWAMIFGEDEISCQVAKFKNMASGEESEVPLDKIAAYLRELDGH